MKIADYLKKENVFTTLDTKYESTTAFYSDFSLFLQERKIIPDPMRIKRLFIKRESLQSTGIGRGAAAPHVYADDFSEFLLALSFVRKGIDFKSPDNQPVYLIFLLMSTEAEVSLHLKMLSRVAKLVGGTDIVSAVRNARSTEEICELIAEREKLID